jgi:hypothetical protein
MKNRKREICTSGSVRDEAGQPPHLLGVSLVASGSKSTKPLARLDDHVVAEAMERALFGGTLDDILNASDSTNLEAATQSDKVPRASGLE